MLDLDTTSNTQFVEAEFLCASEKGLVFFGMFLQRLASKGKKIVFTRLHLSGDKHLKHSEDIHLGPEGC